MNFDAILFDCDGVLVDSEPITSGVLRDMLEESGWAMTAAECLRFFSGKTVRDERATIEARTGQPLTDDWMHRFYERRNLELNARMEIMAGAREAVQAAYAYTGQRIACASGADRFKVEMQLAKVGLMDFFAGRVFSGHEMARSKPAPDVYLAAARHLNAPAQQCLVIEDSVAGVTAGVSAGATVWAYCPLAAHGPALREAGASRLLNHMAELAQCLDAL